MSDEKTTAPAATKKAPAKKAPAAKAPAKEAAPTPKKDFTESVTRKAPQNPEMIEVETTGEFGLTDPISGIDISHEGTTKVPKDSSFTITMLKRKRIKEV